jgi:acyl-homoserine-lactone acylase
MRIVLAALLMGLGCAPSAPAGTEILWDTWGVPHVFAKDNASLFRAFGYAQATSHGNLILKLYGEARGRAAEYWGEQGLPNDRFMRTVGVPQVAKSWYDGQTPAYRQYLDAFAAGINAYAAAHPDQIADSVKAVLPVSGQDVLGHGARVINFGFILFGQMALPKTMAFMPGSGSNMWAIAPKRSASGHAMLIQNPHLEWSDVYTFYEAQLVSPDVNIYGATLVGMPVIAIGFSDSLGWSHTVNTQDGADEFRLTKRGNGYLFDGAVKPFELSTEVLRVKLADGSFRAETLQVKRSVHGPILEEDARSAVSLRVAGLDDPMASEAWWKMGRAHNLGEFEGIVRQMHLPFFNIIYADHDGHIFYFFGGKTPLRPRGTFADWTPPVRGDSSANLWTSYLPYDKLPHITDPASGWLQNANDPPWTTTWPLVFSPDSFPAYMAPQKMAFRPQRSSHMLMLDSSITFDELVSYKHSTHMELADRLLPDLLAAVAKSTNPRAKEGAAVLEQWDRQALADSRGTVLFRYFVQEYFGKARGHAFAQPWRLDAATTTPAGLGNPALAVKSLGVAAQQVKEKHGAIDVPWGDVMRLRYAGKDLPGNGAAGDPFGVFRTAYYAPDDDGKFKILGGDTYYAAIEFGTPLKAKVLLGYGNASQPGSKHHGDQLELFATQQMRDPWRTKTEIESHLELREVIK